MRVASSGSRQVVAIGILRAGCDAVYLVSEVLLALEVVKGGKCTMHRNALRRRVWDPSKACQWAHSPSGQFTLPTYPLKTPTPVRPATSRCAKSTVGWTCFKVEFGKTFLSNSKLIYVEREGGGQDGFREY